ncbi:glutamate racemase [Erysipelothrix sp. HDW6C]|uniref:glutamate racemase n=1 Tax=Erysipelothrix sp. HDW6C TaxID=2714930 RepID=UPI001F0F2167|nr:glutamate racemase [Erysipelothrix sp. HDW6C]
MKKIETLGVFDSGLGGYSVYQDLRHAFPKLNMVLYADQKNAPYGNRSHEAITELARQAMQWFLGKGIEDVLIACNTVSAVALDTLRHDFPTLNIYGIIELTVSQIVPSDDGVVGVVSTKATYDSKAYERNLKSIGQQHVQSMSLDQLVPIIEGMESADAYLEVMLPKLGNITHLILACTHYPLVTDAFQKYTTAIILDSQQPIRDMLRPVINETQGMCEIYTTGDPQAMKKQLFKLFNSKESVRGI